MMSKCSVPRDHQDEIRAESDADLVTLIALERRQGGGSTSRAYLQVMEEERCRRVSQAGRTLAKLLGS